MTKDKEFNSVIIPGKILLVILSSLGIIAFHFWLGDLIKNQPVEFAYYLSGVIIGVIVTVSAMTILKGLDIVEKKFKQ